MAEPRDHPLAIPGAPPPMIERVAVDGATLYAEIRGSGPAILLIPGGAEDAEGWRPVAERLVGFSAITYDRRGTLRSGREDWPGRGSTQHADDAAALIRSLGVADATIVGGSSAGIIALQLALRHPGVVRRALVYEPGYFRVVPEGARIQAPANAAVVSHLERHPQDWIGAFAAFRSSIGHMVGAGDVDPLAPPPDLEWYMRREELNAEPLVRDDIPILTAEVVDEAALAACRVELRFSHGTESMAIFSSIVRRLAAISGTRPDSLDGAGHALYLLPDLAASYISGHGH